MAPSHSSTAVLSDRDEAQRRAGPWPSLSRRELAEAAEVLAESFPQVDAVFLFGSRARADARISSDVDLAFLLDTLYCPMEARALAADLAQRAEDLLGLPVDTVVLTQTLAPGLLFEIFSVETILFARDYERAHRAACRSRAEYRDLLPRLDRQFERVQNRLREHADATH